MEKIVERATIYPKKLPRATRVVAYARVTSEKDAAQHSLSSQVSEYSKMIQEHPGWLYCGVYADSGLTGTKENRVEFQRMLTACRAGKVDLIITKSISRFARNTITLLETVRELRLLGIDVFFEEENIHSLGADGEFMLTLIASVAQEESRSASENQLWRIRKNFEDGKPWSGVLLGYRYDNGHYVIEQEEADTVRLIYRLFLEGNGILNIVKKLNDLGLTTRHGRAWTDSSLTKLLKNYNYTGNLLLQKTFRENHITKAKTENTGQKPQYLAEDTHEAIIPAEVFQAVQDERKRRAERFAPGGKKQCRSYPFTHKVKCGICGRSYRRKTTRAGVIWVCITYDTKGKRFCASKAIPETTLMETAAKVLNMEAFCSETFRSAIDHIEVFGENRLVFCLNDGRTCESFWQDRSRSASWTEEMRENARRTTMERNERNA